jgi:hypothetical protein
MKTQNIDVSKVVVDKKLYPRHDLNWAVKCRYYNALQAGAKFPPIAVAELNEKLILVDGLHRLTAYKENGIAQIPCEVLEGLDKKGIYLEAVKRNITQGQPFSTYDTTKVILDLQKWEMSLEQISVIISLPVDKIMPFVMSRTTSIISTGEDIALKSPLRNLATIPISENPNDKIGGNARTQLAMIEGLIALIKNDWVDYSSEHIKKKMNDLFKLMSLTQSRFVVPEKKNGKRKRNKAKKN